MFFQLNYLLEILHLVLFHLRLFFFQNSISNKFLDGLFNLKWTITFCVPLQDHLNLSSEVILADSGIPATVFSKSRINYRSPFKDKFFVRLEKK